MIKLNMGQKEYKKTKNTIRYRKRNYSSFPFGLSLDKIDKKEKKQRITLF